MPRQRSKHLAMTARDFAQTMRLIGNAFERRQRASERCDKFRSVGKLVVVQPDARVGMMQIGFLLTVEFLQLRAESLERMRKSVAAGARPRAAQHRALKRCDRAIAARPANAQQRMLEQRQ